MLDVPPYTAKNGSEPNQKPDEYWDKFTQYVRLTHGIDAEEEIKLDKERNEPSNAGKDFGADPQIRVIMVCG